MLIELNWFSRHLNLVVSLLNFCLYDLSIFKSWVVKSLILVESIIPFRSIHISFICLCAQILGAHIYLARLQFYPNDCPVLYLLFLI